MAKLLLVEDDETMRRLYGFGLSQEGFEIVTASSAGEALARMEEQHFDLIVLDMMLGGMSGLDFLTTYDVTTKSPGTKVLALSNLDNPAIAQKVLAQPGVVGFLKKAEYEPAALATYLRSVLEPAAETQSQSPQK